MPCGSDLVETMGMGVGSTTLRQLLKAGFRSCGIDIRRYQPQASDDAMIAKLLATHTVDCVFDVGANVGMYAKRLRRVGFGGRIVSFEPLGCAHSLLCKHSKRDRNWIVAPPMALGSSDGRTVVNVAKNLVSSSIRGMTELCQLAAPDAAYVGKEVVRIQTLDSVFHDYVAHSKRPFLKMDTQGYESDVLDGAESCLPRFVGIQAEMSLAELYRGQTLLMDFLARMEGEGFDLAGLFPGFVDPASGRLLQIDGIFFRPLKGNG